MRSKIVFPRELLLVEVERRCGARECGARVFVSLTKAEAREYTGFECERCERRTEDVLSERDIPEWWEELKITSLDGVRPAQVPGVEAEEAGEVVSRMSEAWKRLGVGAEGGEAEGGERETE